MPTDQHHNHKPIAVDPRQSKKFTALPILNHKNFRII